MYRFLKRNNFFIVGNKKKLSYMQKKIKCNSSTNLYFHFIFDKRVSNEDELLLLLLFFTLERFMFSTNCVYKKQKEEEEEEEEKESKPFDILQNKTLIT
jgi:hypothetical protein